MHCARRTALTKCESESAKLILSNLKERIHRRIVVYDGKTTAAILIVDAKVEVNNLPGGTLIRWRHQGFPSSASFLLILSSLFFSLDYSWLSRFKRTRNSLNSLCLHRRTFATPARRRQAERAKAHPGLSHRDSSGKRESKWCRTTTDENCSDLTRPNDGRVEENNIFERNLNNRRFIILWRL